MSELYERLKKFENQEIAVQVSRDSLPDPKVRLICVSPEIISMRDEATNNELHWLLSEIRGYQIVKDLVMIILR